jgi:hypothetical protein
LILILGNALLFFGHFMKNSNMIRGRDSLGLLGEPDNNNGADAMANTIIADTPEPALAIPLGGPEASAPHDDGIDAKPLDLEADPLLHVVVLDDVNLEGDVALHQRLSKIRGLGGRESIEVVFELLMGFLVGGVDGKIDGAPVGSVEDAGRAYMEENDVVTGSEIVQHRPFHGERALVAQIDCDGDFPVSNVHYCIRRYKFPLRTSKIYLYITTISSAIISNTNELMYIHKNIQLGCRWMRISVRLQSVFHFQAEWISFLFPTSVDLLKFVDHRGFYVETLRQSFQRSLTFSVNGVVINTTSNG